MSNEQTDVTVLMPCYNEEGALPAVVKDIRAALDGTRYSYEIIVVDDCSTDKSAEVARQLGCHVIHMPFRRGAGASRKAGILKAKGEIVVMLDADGTYTPADIPKMLEYFPAYDQVNGARTSEKGDLRLLRIPVKWSIRMLASFLANQIIPDLNTGLKAFKREMMLRYLWTIPDGFSCVTSMTLSFLCNGHPVKYIPTEYHKRIGFSKFHPIKDTYYYAMNVCRIIMYFDPLRIFFPVAGLLVIGGMIKLLPHFNFAFSWEGIILLFAGITIGLHGLLADLIVAQARARWLVSKENSNQ